MKRAASPTRLTLSVLVLLVVTGCGVLDLLDPIAGNWTLYFDWGSTGSFSVDSLTLDSDGTFTLAGHDGTWSLDGDSFTMTFGADSTTYWGTLASSRKYLAGTMKSYAGVLGQWHATKN
jgi:hypothetical protein